MEQQARRPRLARRWRAHRRPSLAHGLLLDLLHHSAPKTPSDLPHPSGGTLARSSMAAAHGGRPRRGLPPLTSCPASTYAPPGTYAPTQVDAKFQSVQHSRSNKPFLGPRISKFCYQTIQSDKTKVSALTSIYNLCFSHILLFSL